MESEWTRDQEAAALAFCHLYQGTRHAQRRLKPGRGADCIRFTIGAIQAAGILPDFDWPSYPQNIGWHRDRNWLADLFLHYSHAKSIPVNRWAPLTGDVGIFKTGRTSNHAGLVVAGRFWHVTAAAGVHDCAIESIQGALQEIIRLTSPGLRRQPEEIEAI